MYYAVIRAILGDNCNMPTMKTASPGPHGLLLKGTAWPYNYHSDWQGEGRVAEQQEKKSFQSGWTDQLPGTPCCSGQARVPVTSCPTLILSAEFPEDSSCCRLQTTVSARSTWERAHAASSFLLFREAVRVLSTHPRCWVLGGWGCWEITCSW